MNRYKFRIYILILITWLYLFSFFAGSVFAGQGSDNNINIEDDLTRFVLETYQQYGEGEFDGVYERLYPLIKDNLTREDYIAFQEDNFKKYNLVIEKVNVEDINKTDELPGKLGEIIPADYKFTCYVIKIKYKALFDTALGRQTREISKDVFMAREVVGEDPEIYLLWDPSVVDRQQEG